MAYIYIQWAIKGRFFIWAEILRSRIFRASDMRVADYIRCRVIDVSFSPHFLKTYVKGETVQLFVNKLSQAQLDVIIIIMPLGDKWLFHKSTSCGTLKFWNVSSKVTLVLVGTLSKIWIGKPTAWHMSHDHDAIAIGIG